MDSICKNVGAPYTTLWADRIVPMFMESYRIVDQGFKVRMEELLSTWRNTGPGGRPLFGEAAQWNIERSLYGSQGPPSAVPQPQQAFAAGIRHGSNTPQHISPQGPHQAVQQPGIANPGAAAIVERFDRLIATSQQNQHYNPAQFDATRHEALTKLRALLAGTPLSASDLGQIETQLGALETEMLGQGQVGGSATGTPHLVRSPNASFLHSSSGQHPQHGMSTFGGTHSPRPNVPAALPPSLAGALASLGKLGGATPPPQHSGASAGKPAAGANAIDLIASLRKAGLLPSSAGASATPTPERTVAQDSAYCEMVSGLHFKLTVTDLQQREPPLGSLDAVVAHELPLQCRQCANRYPSGVQGQASLDKHLDWHFRQNRRAKDSVVRGQSRAWFSKLDEWVRGGHDDTAPLRRTGDGGDGADGGDGGGGGGSGSALTPQQEAELKEASKSFVLAPTDDPEAAARPCPVCKELFKSEWSEDEEDFVWKNCVHVDAVYYHGSCFYSAKTLRSSVAGRVKVAAGGGGSDGSRGGTPQLGERSPQVGSASFAVPVPVPSQDAEASATDAAAHAEAGKPVIGIKRERSPTPQGAESRQEQGATTSMAEPSSADDRPSHDGSPSRKVARPSSDEATL